MPQKVKWFHRIIHLDEIYYVFFADKKRKMTDKELAQYNYINRMPDPLRVKMLAEMNPADNPNVTLMTGRQVMDAASKGYIPQFDKYFEKTHRMTLLPASGMEFFMEHSRMVQEMLG